ncbi:MAG: MFS transporter [Promethearchaeota archaeon]|nr:MAG: MFS transporter [Candidatus Lokiarchaeota archaeon]
MTHEEYEYKSIYTSIFGVNYFTQGVYTSIFSMVIPVFLLSKFGSVNSAALAFMLSIILLPTAIKIIYGLITDTVKIKNLGRRKPWIIFPSIVGGMIWIYIAFIIPSTANAAINLFIVSGLIISTCIYFSDTALDGFLLDICPKSELGRTQGFCWGLRAFGIIFGGPIILIFLVFLPIEIIFIGFGLLMIIFSSLSLYIKDIGIIQMPKIKATFKDIFKKKEHWKLFGFSFLLQIVGGVVYTFLALYILIRMGVLNPQGARVTTYGDVSIYEYQAFITLIISIGIIIGAILAGIIADKKSRRLAITSGLFLYIISLILILLPVPIPVLLVFAFLVGAANAWYWAAYSALAGQYAKNYPGMISTFFALLLSFINLGTILGFVITGIWFNTVSQITSDTLFIFGSLFIFMAILEVLSIIPFLMLKRENYEYKLAD